MLLRPVDVQQIVARYSCVEILLGSLIECLRNRWKSR